MKRPTSLTVVLLASLLSAGAHAARMDLELGRSSGAAQSSSNQALLTENAALKAEIARLRGEATVVSRVFNTQHLRDQASGAASRLNITVEHRSAQPTGDNFMLPYEFVDTLLATSVEFLGAGGMGAAFKVTAHCTKPPQDVVIKKVQCEADGNGDKCMEMATVEAIFAEQVQHNGFVRGIHNVRAKDRYNQKDSLFMIQELMAGGDMTPYGVYKHAQGKGKEVAKVVLARWFSQIFEALEYLHSTGMIHRDLKPDNLFLTEGGADVKIADPGCICCLSNHQCVPGVTPEISPCSAPAGTAMYMSPRMWYCHGKISQGLTCKLGNSVSNPQDDLWAMGMMLYEVIFKKYPDFLAQQVNGAHGGPESLFKRYMAFDVPPLSRHDFLPEVSQKESMGPCDTAVIDLLEFLLDAKAYSSSSDITGRTKKALALSKKWLTAELLPRAQPDLYPCIRRCARDKLCGKEGKSCKGMEDGSTQCFAGALNPTITFPQLVQQQQPFFLNMPKFPKVVQQYNQPIYRPPVIQQYHAPIYQPPNAYQYRQPVMFGYNLRFN